MEQRISFITLAVSDLRRSKAFYIDGLGWTPIFEADDVLMLPVGEHLILSLWTVDGFIEEVGREPAVGVAPMTLAHNVATEAEVDDILALAGSLEAEVSLAQRREWGGYSGYFADPDGFRWEVAVNPGPTGRYVLPDAAHRESDAGSCKEERSAEAIKGPLRAVMFFVDDQRAAAEWYRTYVLNRGEIVEDAGYVYIDVNGFEVGFHPADNEKNPQGISVVAYFATDRLDALRAKLLDVGAHAHRGPLDIGGGEAICQLVDPFGNVFGLQGRR